MLCKIGKDKLRPTDSTYRPDIDGLRAIAVLAVVAYHAAPAKIRGGFVGVDVFFVISGFLISGILLRGAADGTLSLLGFYARRVRRIFPALCVVMLVTMILGWRFLLPDEFAQLGRHVLAGSLFSSNLLLWSEVGYFDVKAELKPLLHLWSLGIEEQFYLFWPLILLLILRLRLRLVPVVALAAALSFSLNLYFLKEYPSATFYSPITRIWELLVGALLAIHSYRVQTTTLHSGESQPWVKFFQKSAPNIAGALGLLLIVGACMTYSRETPFPGWHAVVPTAGALLIIAAGPRSLTNRWFLSNRVAVYIGLISYPLYLWHWPLLSYANIAVLDDLNTLRMLKGAAVIAAVLGAALTYHLVELPVRRWRQGSAVKGLTAALSAAALLGVILMVGAGFSGRFSPTQLEIIENLENETKAAPDEYRRGACFLTAKQSFDDLATTCRSNGRANAVLWGDSYAAHLYPGLKVLSNAEGKGLSQFTMSACPPVLGYRSNAFPHCEDFNERMREEIKGLRHETLILAADWLSYFLNAPNFVPQLAASLDRVRAEYPNILIVGPPVAYYGTQAKLAIRNANADRAPNASLGKLRMVDNELRMLAAKAGIRYVSPISDLCHEQSCALFVRMEGRRSLIAWDWAHLTRDGSIYYARTFIAPNSYQ